jgi:hypothetical protein
MRRTVVTKHKRCGFCIIENEFKGIDINIEEMMKRSQEKYFEVSDIRKYFSLDSKQSVNHLLLLIYTL